MWLRACARPRRGRGHTLRTRLHQTTKHALTPSNGAESLVHASPTKPRDTGDGEGTCGAVDCSLSASSRLISEGKDGDAAQNRDGRRNRTHSCDERIGRFSVAWAEAAPLGRARVRPAQKPCGSCDRSADIGGGRSDRAGRAPRRRRPCQRDRQPSGAPWTRGAPPLSPSWESW